MASLGLGLRGDHDEVGEGAVGDEGLAPRDGPAVTVPRCPRLDGGHIGPCSRLRHGEGSDPLSRDRRDQPPAPLVGGPEPVDVVRPQVLVRAEGGGHPAGAASRELLGDHGVGHQVGPGASVVRLVLRPEQSHRAGPSHDLAHGEVPGLLPSLRVGTELPLHERADGSP